MKIKVISGMLVTLFLASIMVFSVLPASATEYKLGIVGGIDMPDDGDAQYMGRFTALSLWIDGVETTVEGRLKTLVTYDSEQGGRILILQGHVDDIEVIHLKCMVDTDREKVIASWDKTSETGDSNAKGTFYWKYFMNGRIGDNKDLAITLYHYAWGSTTVRPRPGYMEIIWMT